MVSSLSSAQVDLHRSLSSVSQQQNWAEYYSHYYARNEPWILLAPGTVQCLVQSKVFLCYSIFHSILVQRMLSDPLSEGTKQTMVLKNTFGKHWSYSILGQLAQDADGSTVVVRLLIMYLMGHYIYIYTLISETNCTFAQSMSGYYSLECEM